MDEYLSDWTVLREAQAQYFSAFVCGGPWSCDEMVAWGKQIVAKRVGG